MAEQKRQKRLKKEQAKREVAAILAEKKSQVGSSLKRFLMKIRDLFLCLMLE